LVVFPLFFGRKRRSVIWRKAFDLFLCQVHQEVVFVLQRGPYLLRRNDEPFAGEPTAGVHDDEYDPSGRLVKNYVVNLAQLLIIEPIDLRAANVESSLLR